jgi:hypothetical protein
VPDQPRRTLRRRATGFSPRTRRHTAEAPRVRVHFCQEESGVESDRKHFRGNPVCKVGEPIGIQRDASRPDIVKRFFRHTVFFCACRRQPDSRLLGNLPERCDPPIIDAFGRDHGWRGGIGLVDRSTRKHPHPWHEPGREWTLDHEHMELRCVLHEAHRRRSPHWTITIQDTTIHRFFMR